MIENIEVGNFVQLKTGQSPKMSVSAIDEINQTATVVWFDIKKRKNVIEILPLNVLKVVVEPLPINKEDLLNALRR